MTEASISDLLPIASENNQLNPEVESVAHFLQESGLNEYPALYELFRFDDGYSLGITNEASQLLHLDTRSGKSHWLLHQISLGRKSQHQVLVVYRDADDSDDKAKNKKIIGGFFTQYQHFIPLKANLQPQDFDIPDLSLGKFNTIIDIGNSIMVEDININLSKISQTKEKLTTSDPLSAESIRHSNWEQVAKAVLVRAELHPEWQPSLEELQALLCVAKVVEVGYIPEDFEAISDWPDEDDDWLSNEPKGQIKRSFGDDDAESTHVPRIWSAKDLPWPIQPNTDSVILIEEIDTSIVEPPTQLNTGYHDDDQMIVASSLFGDVISDPYGDEYKSPLQLPIEVAISRADQTT